MKEQFHMNETSAAPIGGEAEEIALLGLGRWGGGPVLNTLSKLLSPGLVHGIARSNRETWSTRQDLPANVRIHGQEFYEKGVLDNPRIKAVIIATQFSSHYELARKALLAGKDVLLEKPFTRTVQEAEDLEKIAREHGRLLAVGHEFMHDQKIQRLGRAIARRCLGVVSSAEFNMLNPLMGRKLDTSSNVLQDLATHVLSMIRALFGPADIEHLKVDMSPSGERARIDCLYRQIEMSIVVDRDYQVPERKRTITVKGDKLMVTLDYQKGTFAVEGGAANGAEQREGLSAELAGNSDDKTTLEIELSDFLDACRGRRTVINDAEVGIWITRCLAQIEKQAAADG